MAKGTQTQAMKVFNFSRNGASYLIQAPTKKEARVLLKNLYGVDIQNCFEVKDKSTADLTQCTSCSGFFEPENTRMHGDDDFCINCSEGINNEVKQEGIKHLDEFLKSNKLEKKFWLFARAKWSGLTVKELKELEGE